MRIGVDAREIQNGVITGIGRSLANFIDYFLENDKDNTLVLLSEKKIECEFSGNFQNAILNPSLHRFIWDQVILPRALSAYKINLFYSPYYKAPLLTNVPVVNQVLDLMFLIFPPYRSALGVFGKLYYSTFGKAFSKKAVSIITDSQHAKKDIIRLWQIDQSKIKIIPLSLAERYHPVKDKRLLNMVKSRFNLPERFILYLGNFKPHKNVPSLVKAFKIISDKYRDYKLVLAGSLDANGLKIQDLVSKQGLSDRIIFTDTIREKDYPEALLTMADLFVFPTLYEGFGLPPLEAMACGTPVVASKLTSVPEVVGNAGILVDPLNIKELCGTIDELLQSPEKRQVLSKKGIERSRFFKKELTVGRTYDHLMELLHHMNHQGSQP